MKGRRHLALPRRWRIVRNAAATLLLLGALAAALVTAVAGLAALDFDRAFTLFHAIFFPGKDNWLFDWRTDQIILVMPEAFFRNCAILIAAVLLLCCLALILSDRPGRRKAPRPFSAR